MLAVVDALAGWPCEFVAIGPKHGRLADALRARGIELIGLSLREESGVRVPRDEACARLLETAEESRADLLHANSLSMGRLTGAIAQQLRIPCTAHLRDIIKLSQAAVADLNRNAHLVAVSQATRSFHLVQGISADRTTVVYNGVERGRAADGPCDPLPERCRDAFLIATIGQIGLRKGQDVLAAAAVLNAAAMPDAHYLIVGERYSKKAESIAFERGIAAAFEAAGIRERLHLLGYRDDVPGLLERMDLLVHPARQEPFGRVLLEGAAAGVPIVATRVGGTEEMLTDGEGAVLVAPDDAPALAGAILDLYHDCEKRRWLGRAARAAVQERFTVARAAEGVLAVWEQALGIVKE